MRRLLLFIIVLVIAACGVFLWWKNGIEAVSSNTTLQRFVVPENFTTNQIAAKLKSEDLIKDQLVFVLLAKKDGFDGKLQSGEFLISQSMNPREILSTVSKGSTQVWVTIPEGLRATEISQILQNKIPTFNSSWTSRLVANEGYLFPDTYLFSKKSTIDEIVSAMKNNFDLKYQEAAANKTASLSQNQVVILASIVQREAITAHDMQYVASVLENRLSIGMALGSDVTLEYALGYQTNEHTWWKKDLSADDLTLQTPYNTRVNAGLPPTPISNPGLVALEAVLNPPQSNFLYYVSDKNGVLHFAATLQQHNANVAKYAQ